MYVHAHAHTYIYVPQVEHELANATASGVMATMSEAQRLRRMSVRLRVDQPDRMLLEVRKLVSK